MRYPLPFNKVAWLMLRNTRIYYPIDPDFGDQLGIDQRAAIAIAYFGQIVGFAAMIGAMALVVDPLIPFSRALFLVTIVFAFFATQILVSYGLYRLWRSRWPAEA